jgi:hypothetical protein
MQRKPQGAAKLRRNNTATGKGVIRFRASRVLEAYKTSVNRKSAASKSSKVRATR